MYAPVGQESVSRVGPCVGMGASSDGQYVVLAQPHAIALFSVNPFEQISNALHLDAHPSSKYHHHHHRHAGEGRGSFTGQSQEQRQAHGRGEISTPTPVTAASGATSAPQPSHFGGSSSAKAPAFFHTSRTARSSTDHPHVTGAGGLTISSGNAAPFSGGTNSGAAQSISPAAVGTPQHIVPLAHSSSKFCVTTSKGYVLFFIVSEREQGQPGTEPPGMHSGATAAASAARLLRPGPAVSSSYPCSRSSSCSSSAPTPGPPPFSSSSSSTGRPASSFSTAFSSQDPSRNASATPSTSAQVPSGSTVQPSAPSSDHAAFLGCPQPIQPPRKLQFDPHAPHPRPLVAHTLTACCVVGNDVLCASKIGIIDFVPWGLASFDPQRTIDLRTVCGTDSATTTTSGGGGGSGSGPSDMDPTAAPSSSSLSSRRGAVDSFYATSMTADPVLRRVVVLTNSGAVLLLALGDDGNVKGTQLWTPAVPAVHVSVNVPFHLIAVADATAKISVFRMETDRRSGPHSLLYTLTSPQSSKVPPPEGQHRLLSCLWSPDGYSLAQVFRTPAITFTSVFGCHLADTSIIGRPASPQLCLWAKPGYHVLYITASSDPLHQWVCRLKMLRSARVTTPSLCHEESLVLVGPESIYINPDSGADAGTRHNVDRLCDTQWQRVQIPQAYRESNGPVYTAAVDRTGQYIAVAGQRGLIHYNTLTGKWKMFGNVAHERDLIVTAGLAWWRSSHIVVAAYIESLKTSQLQLYSRTENLDADRVVVSHRLSRDVVLLNVLGDLIVAVTSRRRALVFRVSLESATSANGGIDVRPASTLESVLTHDISAHVPFLSSLMDVSLTYVAMDSLTPSESTAVEAKSMVLNVAGHLHLFPIERVVDRTTGTSSSVLGEGILLATDVEAAWVPPVASTRSSSLLLDALWFSCGRMGLKVWFPLERADLDTSRRIMLTFPLDTSPLALLFREAVVIGASVDAYETRTPGGMLVSCNTVHRKTQLNMHPILRQLLRRGLARPAKMIADTLTDLPYFPHLLELMLHHVLEDEAADPDRTEVLLPTVIEFIQQYDQWLDIVVHCARKTEMAKWDYLFECVGSPMASFEACVRARRLETGASYLMVVQALQDADATRRQTIDLLRLCLTEKRWALAQDLIRFYKATSESSQGGGEPEIERTIYNYAHELLQASQWATLGQLDVTLSFHIRLFLASLTAAEACVRDFAKAIDALQLQFPLYFGPQAKGNDAINKSSADKLRFLLDLVRTLPAPDWALVIALVLRNQDALQEVLQELRPPSRAAKLVVRIQTHISTDATLSDEPRSVYLEMLRLAADTLPSTDVTSFLTRDDIEREVDYSQYTDAGGGRTGGGRSGREGANAGAQQDEEGSECVIA